MSARMLRRPARIKTATEDYMPIVQPLTGGLPLDRVWKCMSCLGR